MADSIFMAEALNQAEKAFKNGEVPVGAVIVYKGEIIAKGYNKREEKQNALLHAELEVIEKACQALGRWRLEGCTLYVTLEPCPMCSGGIINSRIDKVVFGAYDDKAGSMGTMTNLCDFGYNHRPGIIGGYMESECKKILEDFFISVRRNK